MSPTQQPPADLVRAVAAALAARDAGTLEEEAVLVEFALAHRVRSYIGDDPSRVEAFDLALDRPLAEWILGLPFELAEAGRIDDALEVGRSFAEVMHPETLLGDRAEILATSGRCEEAREQVDENVERFPESVWTAVKCGYALEECGHIVRAEALYRRGLELAKNDPSLALLALEQLVPLLERSGRMDEAAELDETASALREALDESAVPLPGLPAPELDALEDDEAEDSGAGPEERRFAALMKRLFAFATRDEYTALHETALAEWFTPEAGIGSIESMLRAVDDEWAASAFLEWLIFDLRDERGRTVLEEFARLRGTHLAPADRAIVERLGASYLAPFEVLSVDEGTGFTAVDVLGDARFLVRAPEESEWLVPGDFFAGRLVDLDGALRLTGAVVPLDRARRDELAAQIESGREQGSAAELLKRRASLFMRFV